MDAYRTQATHKLGTLVDSIQSFKHFGKILDSRRHEQWTEITSCRPRHVDTESIHELKFCVPCFETDI